MKTLLVTAIFAACLHSSETHAQTSLAACSKKKIRQLELLERTHNTTARGRKYAKRIDARQQVAKIDEWLWRNCRSYAEEMRRIEQQHM